MESLQNEIVIIIVKLCEFDKKALVRVDATSRPCQTSTLSISIVEYGRDDCDDLR